MGRHKNIALFVSHIGCPHRCIFCDQKSISGSSGKVSVSDIDKAVNEALQNRQPDDIYEIAFFGGSFTAIKREYMIELLDGAYKYIKDGSVYGIRISTRPDYIDEEILALLKQYRVTAIELGAQSMDDEILRIAERGHKAKDVIKAGKLIKDKGFSLGLQMMTGLPGDTEEKSFKTAEQFALLKPDTVRIYPAVVIKGTPMEQIFKNGAYKPQTLHQAVKLCSALLLFFESKGINVIKLGLQDEPSLRENFIAGALHPAFRELCESTIYLENIKTEIINRQLQSESITVFVGARYISRAVGHKKENLLYFRQKGYNIFFKTDNQLEKYQIRIEAQ